MKGVDYVIGLQGMYYLLTGIWPLIHLSSFEIVVGYKPDKFQFFTTTLLISLIAIALLASIKKEKTRSIRILSLGSPLVFLMVELWFGKDGIRPVFILDACIQVCLLLVLGYFFLKKNL